MQFLVHKDSATKIAKDGTLDDAMAYQAAGFEVTAMNGGPLEPEVPAVPVVKLDAPAEPEPAPEPVKKRAPKAPRTA